MNDLIKLIKELRIKTGAGFLECKEAIIYSKGNIEIAIDYLRTKGLLILENKSKKIASEGSIFLHYITSRGVLLEINVETDFVINNEKFQNFGKEIACYACIHKIDNIEQLNGIFKEKILCLVSQIKENIVLSRILIISGNIIGSYLHSYKIGVLITGSSPIKKTFKITELLKQLAMHIASEQPRYLSVESIPKEIINKERSIQFKIAEKTGKPLFLLEKIVHGRTKKFIDNITLLGQNFIINPKKKINMILKENGITINNFVRMQIGKLN